MGIESSAFDAQYWISSSEFAQHDQCSARNSMAIAKTSGTTGLAKQSISAFYMRGWEFEGGSCREDAN
eukprot:5913396-Heterocapsa_arctica.AAC.1